MLKLNNFKKLEYDKKKELLINIFGQIQTDDTDFHDTIFLLEASDSIRETTLDETYQNIIKLLEINKETDRDIYKNKLKEIQKKMHEDSERESKEADALLDTI